MGKFKTVSKPMNIHLKTCFPVIPCNWDLRVVSLGASNIILAYNSIQTNLLFTHHPQTPLNRTQSLSNPCLAKRRTKTANLSWMSSFPKQCETRITASPLTLICCPHFGSDASSPRSDFRCVTHLPGATTSRQPF